MPFTSVRKKKRASIKSFLVAIGYIIHTEGQVMIEKYPEADVKDWIKQLTDAGIPCNYQECWDDHKIAKWMIWKTDKPKLT